MPKATMKAHSRSALMGVTVIGRLIKVKRLERRMRAIDLAERAGISRALLYRIEKGDPSCSVGAVFEVAAILGAPPFDEANAMTMAFDLARIGKDLERLPRGTRSVRKVSDDF